MTQEEITVPKNWKKVFLEDVCKIVSGNGFPKAYQNLVSTGIPFIKVSDMNLNGNEKHILTSNFSVNDKIIKKINAKKYPEGTIIFPKIGGAILTNKKRILSKSSCFDNNVMGLIPNKEINGNFFYYVIQGLHLKDFIKNGPIPSLDTKKFIKFQFLLPPLSIQKQIVAKLDHILGELEVKKKETLSLIEQNKERIEFFEKNWMSYLTNSKIENHPKRKEWKMVTLTDIVSPEKNALKSGPFGSSLKKEFYVKSGYKIYGQEQVIRGDHEYGNYFINENRFQMLKSCEVKPYDLLISLVGTIGKTLILPHNAKKGIINPRLIKITFNKQLADVEFFQLYFDSSNAKSHFQSKSHGGTMNILNMGILKKLLIPLPPLLIQKQIVQNIKYAEEKFQLQKKQFENIKKNYDSKINYINHIQSAVLDSVFSGKLLN